MKPHFITQAIRPKTHAVKSKAHNRLYFIYAAFVSQAIHKVEKIIGGWCIHLWVIRVFTGVCDNPGSVPGAI